MLRQVEGHPTSLAWQGVGISEISNLSIWEIHGLVPPVNSPAFIDGLLGEESRNGTANVFWLADTTKCDL
jgi:hypothetical protein